MIAAYYPYYHPVYIPVSNGGGGSDTALWANVGAATGLVLVILFVTLSDWYRGWKERRAQARRARVYHLKKTVTFCQENARFHRHCMRQLAKWWRKEKHYNARTRFIHDAVHHRDSAKLWEAQAAKLKGQLNRRSLV